MTKIKVVHICTYKNGGAGRAAYRIHEAVSKLKEVESIFLDQNDFITFYKKPNILNRLLKKLGLPEISGINRNNQIAEKISGEYEKISFPQQPYFIENHSDVLSADIIHLHWVADLINYKTFFKKLKNKSFVWTLHDMNPIQGIFHYKNDILLNPAFKEIEQKTLLQKKSYISIIDKLVVVSPSKWLETESKNSEILGHFPHYQIQYSLPSAYFENINQFDAKKYFNLDMSIPTLLFVSDHLENKRKGHNLLISAIKKLSAFSVQILIVGTGNILFDNQYIKQLGHINDEILLRKIYTAADLCIVPSLEDNLPNVMLESFASGTPVLSFNTGGMAELIEPNFNGLIAAEKNSDSLAKVLSNFVLNKNCFDRESIIAFARQNFSEISQANNYARIYTELISMA